VINHHFVSGQPVNAKVNCTVVSGKVEISNSVMVGTPRNTHPENYARSNRHVLPPYIRVYAIDKIY
jgi:hypothetical protein